MSIVLADTPAPQLADYGFFEDASARNPVARVISYDLINPLFSDHAEKHRYVFIPEGKTAVANDDGMPTFPIGSVLIKTFAFAPDMRSPDVDEYYVETRLLIHKKAGWAAYPYLWNEDQTEARYSPIGGRRDIETITPNGERVAFNYAVPNKNQCKTCHQSGDDVMPIGPKLRNLAHIGPNNVEQTAHWQELNILHEEVPAIEPVASSLDESKSLEARARGYLDINCAHCHKADGAASNSGLWLTWVEKSRVRLGFGKHPTAAGRGSGDGITVIEPGNAARSILAYRMASDEAGIAMPELGRTLVDEEGVALIEAWIAQMSASGSEDQG